MATNDCCSTAVVARARRLSDLLREQQEPFLLLHHLLLQDHDDDDDDSSGTAARTPTAASARARNLLRGTSTTATVTKLALRWADDLLAGCFSFSCAAARQTRFRRLPRADDGGIAAPDADRHDGAAGECCVRQQLSPVSVLDLHSDDESSPVPSHRDEQSDDDGNCKPSTSGTGTSPSPLSIHDHDLRGKTPAMEVERFQGKSVASAWDCEWETVAADISRIPSLVELDLSASPRDDWRRLVVVGGEEEARQVARSIEAMIFEEVRWEAVRDMLCSPQH
ncbi:hypothetical protein BDA96_08G205000 [Sorghum bicolor]|uniref:Uncharacterized protein n=2 Tax=Sorghum bicolor TaxID=4558 RepID=A0A921QGW2_SORBI|nr:uncharacterized protein LOC110429889 [Sorghum bicolor]KAG0521939.1 hypothetical protein BDA96_08G205000 [Sorghum bicolor]KAG0521940.1 hypothetical protein BDA96_08G205000 [Sorghum bicolor]KXG24119.1 hypothetical protein SORBI_3008G187400 [Sorghum bicolor]OQU79723.1 hypothetical protein SORBI_3008G187400 [Sorghum bicolor]|eukprot:XP_021302299.1 uncharacterized protein LOC110429889 [Sorghum bicolor]